MKLEKESLLGIQGRNKIQDNYTDDRHEIVDRKGNVFTYTSGNNTTRTVNKNEIKKYPNPFTFSKSQTIDEEESDNSEGYIERYF